MIDAEKRTGMDSVFKSIRPKAAVTDERAVELCALLVQKADASTDKKVRRQNMLACSALSKAATSCVAKDENAELLVDAGLLEYAEKETEGMVLAASPVSDAFERVAKSLFSQDSDQEGDGKGAELEHYEEDEGWSDPDLYALDLNETEGGGEYEGEEDDE